MMVRTLSGVEMGMIDFWFKFIVVWGKEVGYNQSVRGYKVYHCIPQGSVGVLRGCEKFKVSTGRRCRASFRYVYVFNDACAALAAGS